MFVGLVQGSAGRCGGFTDHVGKDYFGDVGRRWEWRDGFKGSDRGMVIKRYDLY